MSSNQKKEEKKKNIVVLGGGGAGIQVVKELCDKLPSTHHIILITNRERYVHTPAIPRLLVKNDPSDPTDAIPRKFFDEVFMPLDTFEKKHKAQVTIRQGIATRVESSGSNTGGTVLVKTDEKYETVHYEYLVCATGQNWLGPLMILHRDLKKARDTQISWIVRFRKEERIVLIGGGPVALEFAGELLDLYNPKNDDKVKGRKKITIVHRGRLPLNDNFPDTFRRKVRDGWEKRGVRFIFEDEIENYELKEKTITTKKGVVIEADRAILMTGGSPNTDYLKSLGVLNEKGYVKLEQPLTLQVAGHPHIYACGDIADLPGQRTLAKTPKQAIVVAKNISNMIQEKKSRQIYKGMFEGMFLTNGQNRGVGYLGILWRPIFGDRVVSMVKGKGLFLEMGKQIVDLA